MTETDVLVRLFIAAGAVLLLIQFFGRYVYWYQIRETDVRVVLLGLFPLLRVRFCDIEQASEISWWATWRPGLIEGFRTVGVGNRFVGRVVAIQRKKSLLRKTVLITPNNVDQFLADLKERLTAFRGQRERSGSPITAVVSRPPKS